MATNYYGLPWALQGDHTGGKVCNNAAALGVAGNSYNPWLLKSYSSNHTYFVQPGGFVKSHRSVPNTLEYSSSYSGNVTVSQTARGQITPNTSMGNRQFDGRGRQSNLSYYYSFGNNGDAIGCRNQTPQGPVACWSSLPSTNNTQVLHPETRQIPGGCAKEQRVLAHEKSLAQQASSAEGLLQDLLSTPTMIEFGREQAEGLHSTQSVGKSSVTRAVIQPLSTITGPPDPQCNVCLQPRKQAASQSSSLKTACTINSQINPRIVALQDSSSHPERRISLGGPCQSVLGKESNNSANTQQSVLLSDQEVDTALENYVYNFRALIRSSSYPPSGHTSLANSVHRGQSNGDHQTLSGSSSNSVPDIQSDVAMIDSLSGSETSTTLLQSTQSGKNIPLMPKSTEVIKENVNKWHEAAVFNIRSRMPSAHQGTVPNTNNKTSTQMGMKLPLTVAHDNHLRDKTRTDLSLSTGVSLLSEAGGSASPASASTQVLSSTQSHASDTNITSVSTPSGDRHRDLESCVANAPPEQNGAAGVATDIRLLSEHSTSDNHPVISRLHPEAVNNHPEKDSNLDADLESFLFEENSSQSATPAHRAHPTSSKSMTPEAVQPSSSMPHFLTKPNSPTLIDIDKDCEMNLQPESFTTSVSSQTFNSWISSIMNSSTRAAETADCGSDFKKIENVDSLTLLSDEQKVFTTNYNSNILQTEFLSSEAGDIETSQDIEINVPNFLEEDYKPVDCLRGPAENENKSNTAASNNFYQCGHCHEWAFFSQIALLYHIEQEHKNCERMKCPYCQTWFETTRLIAHMSAAHRETPSVSLSCGGTNAGWHCTFTAETCKELERHMAVKHGDEPAYKCAICGFSSTVIMIYIHHVVSKEHLLTDSSNSVDVTSEIDKSGLQQTVVTQKTKKSDAGKQGNNLNKRKDNNEYACSPQRNVHNKQASKLENNKHKKKGQSLNLSKTLAKRKNDGHVVGNPRDSCKMSLKENICKGKKVMKSDGKQNLEKSAILTKKCRLKTVAVILERLEPNKSNQKFASAHGSAEQTPKTPLGKECVRFLRPEGKDRRKMENAACLSTKHSIVQILSNRNIFDDESEESEHDKTLHVYSQMNDDKYMRETAVKKDNGHGDSWNISTASKSFSTLPSDGVSGETDDTSHEIEEKHEVSTVSRTSRNTSRSSDAKTRQSQDSSLHQEDGMEGMVYCCNRCEYKTCSLFHFRLHMAQHMDCTDRLIPVRPAGGRLCCGICAYFALDFKDFDQHAERHLQEKPLLCGHCYVEFNTEDQTRTHIYEHHPGYPIRVLERKLLYVRMNHETQKMIQVNPKVSLNRSEVQKHLKTLKLSRQNKRHQADFS